MGKIPKVFEVCQKSLREISCDTSQKRNEYMCSSALPAFDFDAIKEWYAETYLPGLSMTPCSNDALWLNEKHITFIEFKNGKIDGSENNKIIFKLYDSLLLLLDEKLDVSWYQEDFKPNISYTREHMDYILVYNQEKFDKKNLTPQTRRGKERQLQDSSHRTLMYKTLRNLGKKSLILFGLDRFEGYLFHRVYTMDQVEFENYLLDCGVNF